MKPILFVLVLVCSVLTATAQMRNFFEIYPGEKVMTILSPGAVYSNDQFTVGTVRYSNGKSVERKLNYYILFDEMHYLNGNDTLPLERANIDFITIGVDTFKHDGFYFQVLKDYGGIKLVRRKTFALIKRDRTAADSLPFVDSYQVVNNFWFAKDLIASDTLRLGIFDMYYMVDVLNKVQTLHRENLFKIYPQRKQALQNYLSGHPVSLINRKQIEAMLDVVTK